MPVFHWMQGQPANCQGEEDVIVMLSMGGTWVDRTGDAEFGVVCEIDIARGDEEQATFGDGIA